VKITRPVSPAYGWASENLSEDFFHLMRNVLLGAGLFAAVLAVFLHWRISHARTASAQLTEIGTELRKEHAALLAEHNTLTAKNRIAAAAAVRLGLQLPTKEQVHRLY
jgi:cell division protein FtsL